MQSDKLKAQEMRKEGKTLKEICVALERPIGTISVWCNGIKSPKNYNYKKGYKVYAKQVKEDALNSIIEGEPLEKVSLETEIPSATLRLWCEKAEIDFRTRHRYDKELREKARELKAQGLSYEAIQKELNISSLYTLLNWFKGIV